MGIRFALAFILLCFLIACNDVNFTNGILNIPVINPKNDSKNATAQSVDQNQTEITVEPGVRVYRFNPKLVENRPDIEVTTILDNSNSMKPIQEKVKEAFLNVTQQFRGFNGKLNLYSTTNTLDKDKNSFRILTYYAYDDSNGNIITIAKDSGEKVPSSKPYSEIKVYQLVEPHTDDRNSLSFDSDMADEDFETFTASYTYAISQMGVEGSSDEQGICSILRSMDKNKGSENYQIYLLATNENDATTIESCLKEERRDIYKLSTTSENQVACVENEANCKFSYKMNYRKHKKSQLKYDYRKIDEKLTYKAADPNIEYKGTIKWDIKRTKIEYKYNINKPRLTYRKYISIDNVLEESPDLTTKNLPQIEGASCNEAMNGQACSAEHMALIDDAPLGVVAGSCVYSCQTQQSGTKTKYLTDWQIGTCDGFTPVGANACKDEIRGSFPRNEITSCVNKCDTDNKSRTYSFNNQPNSCAAASGTCSAAQETELVNKLGSTILTNRSQLTSCTTACKDDEFEMDSIKPANTVFQCSGLDPDEEGESAPRACNASERAEAAAALGAAIDTCQYTCKQEIKSHIEKTAEPSSCTVMNRACNGDGEDFAGHTGKNTNLQVSCQFQCVEAGPIGACRVNNVDDGKMCGDNLANLIDSCENKVADIYEVDSDSCAITSSLKTVENIAFREEPQDWRALSLVPEGGEAAIADRLFEYHGSKFYLAAFVYPEADETCDPANQEGYSGDRELFIGSKYINLVDAIGEENAKYFPLCDSDYSPALGFVFDLVTEEVNRTYKLEFNPDIENVHAIQVINDKDQVTDVDAAQFSLEDRQVTFIKDLDISNAKEVVVKFKLK